MTKINGSTNFKFPNVPNNFGDVKDDKFNFNTSVDNLAKWKPSFDKNVFNSLDSVSFKNPLQFEDALNKIAFHKNPR